MTDNLCKNSDAIQNTKDVSKPRYVRKPRFVHHDKKTINGDTNNIKELESDSEYTDERRQDLDDKLDRIGIHPPDTPTKCQGLRQKFEYTDVTNPSK